MSRGHPLTEQLLALATQAARSAGAELLRRSGDAGAVSYKSSATDPVSEADQAAEDLIVDLLLTARPDDGLLGEEGADRPGSSGLRWVIDPLDGTVNYLYGQPAWSVSVACEDRDGAVAGAVYDPPRDELWSAARGQGSTCNGRSLAVNDPVALDRALVATGFGYMAEQRARQAALLARLLPRIRDVRRIGSAALDLCALAGGRVDAYYEDGPSPWDWSAGALIAAEAGAVVAARPAGLVAAGPALLDPLLAALDG